MIKEGDYAGFSNKVLKLKITSLRLGQEPLVKDSNQVRPGYILSNCTFPLLVVLLWLSYKTCIVMLGFGIPRDQFVQFISWTKWMMWLITGHCNSMAWDVAHVINHWFVPDSVLNIIAGILVHVA